MEDISLPHDTRVEDILADYFTKKIEGKDVESKEKHSDSQHSSKSKKSKKRKHKKKKKHKSRKAHSENEADEANSSADECWVEVTASSTKENPAKNEAGSPDREPKEKSPSKSKPADTNLSRQDMPQKDGAGTDADKRRAGKGDHQRDTVGKNRTDQAEPSKHSTRRSSQSTSPAKSKGASSSSDSEDDRRNTSKSEPSSSQSANEGSSKKSTKKKGRSYRTKRCRSSGSSEDESDRQSQSRSPSPLRRDSSRRSGQRRSRSASKSRRNSLSKGSARDRSKSKDRKLDRSRDRSRSRKRSSRSRSLHRGHGGSHRSRSPMRSQAGSSRSQKRPESRRSSSPRRSRAARSHSRRRSRSRHSRGRTPPRHSRGRPSPRRSRSRRRSQSRHRPRQSPGRSPKRSQRSTSRDRRHGRKSVSPKKERKSRSRSRKRSTSRQKHSSRRSRSGDRKQSEKRKAVERDKSSEKKGTSGETSLPGDTGVSTTDSKKRSVSKSSEEISGKGHTGDRKSSSDSDKNQVVLYGPFEEEDGSFLDEEPSPERTMPSVKPPQPEACAAAVGKTSKPQPVTDNLEAVPVPEEPAVPPDDSQLEDMDISNPPSPVGALEVDDSLAKSVPSGENTFSPAVPPECGTETSSQQHTPPLKVDSLEESAKKPSMARAAIPWTYSEPQQAPLPPPWVKPETTKPVGQVRPFVREVNPSGSALQKGLLQTKQDGLAVVGTMATVQASNEPPLMGPGRTIGKTEEFGMLENTVKVNEHASFPELATKLVPPAPFTSAPAVPAVNLHGSALYSATVMPVHIPFQFVGVPGQAQVTHGTPTPLPQEKPSPVTQQQQTCPLPTQLGPAGKMLASEQSGPTAAPSQTEGQVLNEVVPPASTKSPPSQLPEDMATDQVGGTAGSAKVKSQSNSSSRSSSPVEKGSSRSSSMERSKSSRSRSRSGDREKAKRSRSSESESPTKDSKRLRKGDSTEREEIRAKSRSRDRHCSSSPDRSKRDSHLKKKSRSPDRKPSKSIDRKRSRSHDRKRSESPERKRSKSRDRKRSKSRERRGSKSRDRKRSQSREKKRSKSRDRKRSKSRDRKRSKSREKKRSKSRDRKRSKSHERKRSKSRERKRSKSREKRRSKSRDRRGSRSRDRRRSKSRDRRRSLSRGRQRVSQRSNSRSRRSRSRDQPRRQSRSRETGHSQRSESRKTNSSQRKPSRERESPRGTLILKRYKNELSSESDSSPERRSKKAPSSPVKKRQRRESDAESTDSQDDKSLDVRTKSSENSKALNIDCIAEHCKEKELQKQQSSEKIADKETPEANTYGPVPPAEASVPSASKPVPEPQQSDETDMDDKQDDPSGTGGCPEPNTANEVSGTSIVSSSSSKENVCQVQERSAAVGSSRPAEVAASTDNRTLKNSEPLEQRQAVATSSSKSFVCGKADVLQGNPEGLSKGEENLHEPVAYEKSIIPSGEGAVSSSTGSPREQEVAESDEARCDASLCQKEPTEKASTPATEPVSACADSSKDSNAEQRTISAREQADPSSTGDAGDTLDVKRKSRSRSRSSASSIEKARMRKESSSSSSSSSEEEHTLKEGSKSRSASPDSQSEEGPAESQVKKTQDKKRSRSREMKRSRSRDKRRSRSREKKRSRSREKKRSKSREKRRSRSRDKSLRSKEKKRSKSRERKISPSRDKKRSRSREKRRSRSREKITIRSRDKRRSRSRERKRSPSRDNRDKRRSSREQRRSRSRDKRRSRSRDKKRSPSRDRKRSRSRERRRSRDKKSRSRSRDKRRSRSREKRRSRSRPRRSWSRAMELQRKRSAERLRKKSRSPRRRSLSKRRSPRKKSRSRSRSRRRSRSHSPERKRKSRSREREPSVVKVDKVQLLEAARKNMQAMLQRGVVAKGLPVAAAAAVNATVKVVAAAVAAAAADPRSSLAAKLDVTATPPSEAPVLPLAMSGDGTGPAVTLGITEEPPKVKKSLAALTEICKAISDEEKREYAGEVEPKTAEEVAEEFQQTHHHPFKLKDPPPPIRFNIPNATNLPVKTLAEKVADAAHLHKQFPVSSGSQHRVKELEWVPVEKTEPAAPVKAARAAKSHTHREEGSTSPLALTPPPAPASTHMPPYPDTFTPLPTVAAAPPVFQVEEVPLPVSSAVISSTVMEPPDAAESLDITAIMSRRVEALKALRENPMDLEAMKVYHSCHKEFQAWIASKQEPGQYTGSIDFKPLTPDELSGPNQAWVKKDQFMKAAPVCEGIGMHLLRKMGWTPGEGLGKNKEGALEPLLPSIKTDKKGLVSELETKRPPLPAHHDLGGKHPVSALTELCIKSRWGPPEFTLAEESGPDHKKTFLFKVKVNGREYQPREPSANKKHARAQAAMLCLQETGVIGRVAQLPTQSVVYSSSTSRSIMPLVASKAAELETGDAHESGARLKPDSSPGADPLSLSNPDDKQATCNSHNQESGTNHLSLSSPDDEEDTCNRLDQDDMSEEKCDSPASQTTTQCNAFNKDLCAIFSLEDIPLESIPLPDGPYIPPEAQQLEPCSSPPKLQSEAGAAKPNVEQQNYAVGQREQDGALEQPLPHQDAASDLRDSISESAAKVAAQDQTETRKETKPVDLQRRAPSLKTDSKGMVPSEQQASVETEKSSQLELPPCDNWSTSNRSGFNFKQQVAESSTSQHKHEEKVPVLSAEQQGFQQKDRQSGLVQPSDSNSVKARLKKLRRESIISVLNNEQLKITPKIVATTQSSETGHDGALLCKQAWSEILTSQKDTACVTCDSKTALAKQSKQAQSNEGSIDKAEPHGCQSSPKLKTPRCSQSDGKPCPQPSADVVQQQPKTAGHSRTTAGHRKWDRFLRQQIHENVVTQLMPGYLLFGNKIVDPAPPVRPPTTEEAKSSPAQLNSQSGEKCKDDGGFQSAPPKHPVDFTTKAAAGQNWLSENSNSQTEVNRSNGAESKPSSKCMRLANGTRQRKSSEAEQSVKPASMNKDKAKHGGHSSVESRAQGTVSKHERIPAESPTRDTGACAATSKVPLQSQENVPQEESSNVLHKQTEECTSGQPETLVTPIPKQVSVLDEINSQPALTTGKTLYRQVEPEGTLSLKKKEEHEDIVPVKTAEDKSLELVQFVQQDTDNPCQQAEHMSFRKVHEEMLAEEPEPEEPLPKSEEPETPLLAENTNITVTAALGNVQSTSASLSSENRTSSSWQDISVQHECLEKNTKLSLGGTVASQLGTGSPQLRAESDLLQSQSYTCESNAAASFSALQDSDGIAPLSIQAVKPECRPGVPLSRDSQIGVSQEAHTIPEKAQKEGLPSEPQLATLKELSEHVVLTECCSGQVCTHTQQPPELSSEHQEEEIDSKTVQCYASEAAKQTIELTTPEVSLTNNDATSTEAESDGMPSMKHEIVKAPCTPPSNKAQEIDIETEESEITKETTEFASPKVSLRNDGGASHEAESDGISPSNEERESASSENNDIDIKISMLPSGDGEMKPQELQRTGIFNGPNKEVTAVSDSNEAQSIQQEPTLEEQQPNSSQHDVSRHTDPHCSLQSVGNENSKFTLLESLLSHEQAEQPAVRKPEQPMLCFPIENLDAQQSLNEPPPEINKAGAYGEVSSDQHQDVMVTQSEALLSKDTEAKSAPACLNEEVTFGQIELQRDPTEPSGDDAEKFVQPALDVEGEQPQRQIAVMEYENLPASLPVKTVEIGNTQPLLSQMQTTIEKIGMSDDHTTESAYSSTNYYITTKTYESDKGIATGMVCPITDHSLEDVQAVKTSLPSTQEESVIEQRDAESNRTVEQLGRGCSYEFMQPELRQDQLKDDSIEQNVSLTPLSENYEDKNAVQLMSQKQRSFDNVLMESPNYFGYQSNKPRSDKLQDDVNENVNLSVLQVAKGVEAGKTVLLLSQAQMTGAEEAHQDSTLSGANTNQLAYEPVLEDAVKQVQVQKVATYNRDQDSFVKQLPEDNGNGTVALPPNQLLADKKQTELSSDITEGRRNDSSHESAFANELENLPEASAGNKQNLTAISPGVNVETETTLLLLVQKQESSEQTNVDGLVTDGADDSTCQHAFADKSEQHQADSLSTEQDFSATLSLKDEAESTPLALIKKGVSNEHTDMDSASIEETNASISEQAHEFRTNVLAKNAVASDNKDLSFPQQLEDYGAEMPLLNLADKIEGAGESIYRKNDENNCSDEAKVQSWDEVDSSVVKHEKQPTLALQDEQVSVHAMQAVVLSAYDQCQGGAREHETNEDSVQALRTAVNPEDIEVASVVEVSAEQTLLSASISVQDGCYQSEECQQELAVTEQESWTVSTAEGETGSASYAASNPVLSPSTPEQVPVTILVESQKTEEGAAKHAVEGEVQSSTPAERSDVAPSSPFNNAPLSPLMPGAENSDTSTAYGDAHHQEVPNEPQNEQQAQPTCPPNRSDFPCQQHTAGRELEAAVLKQTPPSVAYEECINPANPALPPPRLHGDPHIDQKVLVLTSGCGYAKGTKTLTAQHTESSILLPPSEASAGLFNGRSALQTPLGQAGVEAPSSHSLGRTESVQIMLSVPNTVASHSLPMEVEQQLTEPTERTETTDKDAPEDENAESQDLVQKMLSLGKQPATHGPLEHLSSESSVLSKHSQTPPHSPPSPPSPKEHKLTMASAAPKRRARKSSAHFQADTKPETQSLRRSTRSKKPPERFCP